MAVCYRETALHTTFHLASLGKSLYAKKSALSAFLRQPRLSVAFA